MLFRSPSHDNNNIVGRQVYLFEDSFGFGAGSYGGYNQWREQLAALAGYTKTYSDYHRCLRHDRTAHDCVAGPFWELICFSDCEGTIGSQVSKKLYLDFVAYEDEARDLGEDFFAVYQCFKEAFELASDNGAVEFH